MNSDKFSLNAKELSCSLNAPEAPQPYGALSKGKLGLFDTQHFRLTDGRCQDCLTQPQALWYFQDELVAVASHNPIGFNPALQAQADVREWVASYQANTPPEIPPLLWIGSPLVIDGVHLADEGKTMVDAQGRRMPFAVTPKIPTNLSYYDNSSVQSFYDRTLRLRGRMTADGFVARTIWPEDYSLDFARLPYQPLKPDETLQTLVRGDGTQAAAPLAARILWQRDPKAARDWSNRPALSFVLNGAQGDDDEAHGGHFAIATGFFGSQGEWGDWMVNNFYNLDWFSEKGIVASMLPMDAYLADMNSGQSWYRPSYMLVAVLKEDRTANMYQQAIGRVFNHLYRHDFHYNHASANCAGLSLETLRSLGWQIPNQGATNWVKGVAALPFQTIKDQSLESGRKAYDYLTAERTGLYPFAAFEAAGEDLLNRLVTERAGGTAFERMLTEDVEALIYMNIPQFPSSRVFGQAPVASIDEYLKRAPEDRANWKVVPVLPRPFPAELIDPKAPDKPIRSSSIAIGVYLAVFSLIGIGIGIWSRSKRNSPKRSEKE